MYDLKLYEHHMEAYSDKPAVKVQVNKIIRETPKAVLLDLEGDEHWIPFSVIHNLDKVKMTVEIECWFMTKNDIIF